MVGIAELVAQIALVGAVPAAVTVAVGNLQDLSQVAASFVEGQWTVLGLLDFRVDLS